MAVKQPITYNNIKYDSLADLCREYNMMGSYENISVYKKYHNISLEEAFTRYLNNTYKGNKNGVMIKINNKVYNSIKECCDDLNLTYSSVLSYAHYHCTSYEEAIDHFLNNPKKNGIPIKIYNKNYRSIREACKYLNLNYNAIMNYKKYHNISYKEAIDHYLEEGV